MVKMRFMYVCEHFCPNGLRILRFGKQKRTSSSSSSSSCLLSAQKPQNIVFQKMRPHPQNNRLEGTKLVAYSRIYVKYRIFGKLKKNEGMIVQENCLMEKNQAELKLGLMLQQYPLLMNIPSSRPLSLRATFLIAKKRTLKIVFRLYLIEYRLLGKSTSTKINGRKIFYKKWYLSCFSYRPYKARYRPFLR